MIAVDAEIFFQNLLGKRILYSKMAIAFEVALLKLCVTHLNNC